MKLFYAQGAKEDILKSFSSSIDVGLSEEYIKKLQQKYGFNKLQEEDHIYLNILLRQIKSPFMYLLFFAAIISFLLKDYINSIIIFFILFLNIFLSFWQEYKSARILSLLKTHLISKSKVLRNGKWKEIDSRFLVPGDIIKLQAGEIIPADVRFIEANNLSVDESILTGESANILKSDKKLENIENIYKAQNLGFKSTTIVSGYSVAIVLAIGKDTFFGKIMETSAEIITESTFQIQIKKLSKFILITVLITLIVLFSFHLIFKWQQTDIVNLFIFALALSLGLTPEALPTVITFSLSKAAYFLSKRNMIIKRLSSIQDLGALNTLCTDKTGTLTQNKLMVNNVYKVDDDLMFFASLSSIKDHMGLDSFDLAIIQAAEKDYKSKTQSYVFVSQIPYDANRKISTVLLKNNTNNFIIISRGSTDAILNLCNFNIESEKTNKIHEFILNKSKEGNRVLGFAYKKINNINQNLSHEEKDLVLAGFISFADPIKQDAKSAIEKAKKMGIDIKILTGDVKEVAMSVAKQIDLDETKIITGQEFDKLRLEEKIIAVLANHIFSSVLPNQKLEIVTILQDQGRTVGFLGDGINDVPALKKAYVGIVVDKAIDVAKEAADIVLLKKSLDVIISGIMYGRTVSVNIFKYVIITLASNFGNFYSIAIASLFTDFLPILPIQIILLNILSDLPMIAISTDNVDQYEIQKPSEYKLTFIALITTFFGLVSSIFDFIFFRSFLHFGQLYLQTGWFVESMLAQVALLYSLRTKKIFYRSMPSIYLILLSFLASLIVLVLPQTSFGQNFFNFVPIDYYMLKIIFIIVLAYFIINEIMKFAFFKLLSYKK